MRWNQQVEHGRRGGWREQGHLFLRQVLDGDRAPPGEVVGSGHGECPLVVGERRTRGQARLVKR